MLIPAFQSSGRKKSASGTPFPYGDFRESNLSRFGVVDSPKRSAGQVKLTVQENEVWPVLLNVLEV